MDSNPTASWLRHCGQLQFHITPQFSPLWSGGGGLRTFVCQSICLAMIWPSPIGSSGLFWRAGAISKWLGHADFRVGASLWSMISGMPHGPWAKRHRQRKGQLSFFFFFFPLRCSQLSSWWTISGLVECFNFRVKLIISSEFVNRRIPS